MILFGLGALYYFWQKTSNPPFLSDNVLAYGFPWYQKHHIICISKILYFLKLLLNQGWYWCQRGGWLSSLQHHSGGFLLFTNFEFFHSVTFFLKYVTIMVSYFTRLVFNSVEQRCRLLLSLTGDNVQIYCVSTVQVIAVCALFATHAIVLNWYSVCRWLLYSHL